MQQPPGVRTRPASTARYPIRLCVYAGSRNVLPSNMKPNINISTNVMAKSLLPSRRRSTMGTFCRSSHQISTTKAAADTSAIAVMNEEPNQSSSCPRSSTTCRQPRLRADEPEAEPVDRGAGA